MKTIALLPIFFCLTNAISGQNTIGLPATMNFSKTDYHGGSQTWDIQQDNNGIMYFANNEGLLTFDGTYWNLYPLPNRTITRSIAIDGDKIYAGGQGELGVFSPDSHGFLHYHSLLGLLPKSQLNFADIWDIKLLNGAVFFRATDRIFKLKNNIIQVFYPNSEWQFLSVCAGKLYAQDQKNGLYYFDNDQWLPVSNSESLKRDFVSGITEVNKDTILVNTINARFFYLVNRTLKETTQFSEISAYKPTIYKTCELNGNQMVLGTTSEGCIMMDFNGKIKEQISVPAGLQNNNVLCVFADQENNIWAGLNNGISLIAANSAIRVIKPGKQYDLSGFSTTLFNGNLYIGTSNGLYVTTVSTDTSADISTSHSTFTLVNNSIGQVWHVSEVNGQLLMGHNSGTFLVNNRTAVPISKDPSWLSLPKSNILPSPKILCGTYTGLKMLNYSGGKITDGVKLQGVHESFRFLAIDHNGSIWASHPYRGIYKIEISPDQKQFTSKLFTNKDGLPSAINNQLFKIKNRIVFATEKGAYEFDENSGKFMPSAFLKPIFGNLELRYLYEDAYGNIWFCSGKKIGIVRFTDTTSGKNFTINYFPELTNQILSGFENILVSNSQNIFIGSEKGTIHLNLKKYLSAGKRRLNVNFSLIKAIAETDSAVAGPFLNLTQSRALGKSLETNVTYLPSDYNSFHFEYSSPNYTAQKNIEYSYKLDGFEKNWSNWSARTEKDYTNLPDGAYKFMLKARDNLNNESPEIIYSFVISPPFYKTWAAFCFYIFAFLLMFYFLRKWHKNKLAAQQMKLEEKQQRIIALQNLEIEKNEKEIIRLQNAKLANEVLLKKRELADASMHVIEREDALVRVKEELQKLYKKTGNNSDVKNALQMISGLEKSKENWEQFASHFDEINNDFIKKLKARFPGLTHSDVKVCVYLQLNLSSKEIAQLMNISVKGVEMSRYRIRKKLKVPGDDTLNDFFTKMV